MIERPVFKPEWNAPMLDSISCRVAGLIDGRRSADDIADELRGQAIPELVYYALARLEQQGCLAESDGALPAGELETLRTVAVKDYFDPQLDEWNRRALETGEPWMLAGPAWIGPVFRPGRTACWRCLASRLERNRPAVPAALQACVNISVQLLEGALVTIEPAGVRRHLVTRRPQCPACGNATGFEPVVLRGEIQRIPPEETCRRLDRHISPITGIVGDVETWRAGPTHLSVAVLNGSPVIAVGKGRTEIESKAACLAEAAERHSCRWQGDEPRVRASYRGCEHAVHPAAILNFSDAQYRNRTQQGCNRVPLPFDEEAEIDWAPVWSLTRERTRFVPAACCYYQYPMDEEHRFCRADSNGCAAGNTLEEAVLRGLLELIERDAVAIWWYNRLRRPAVDLRSFDDPFFAAMRLYMEGGRRTLDVLELTTELDVPVFAAVSAREDGGGPLLGFGAHLDARAAISGALAELSQMVAADPAEQRQEVRDWLETATLANQPYLVAAPGTGSIPALGRTGDVRLLVEILDRQGMEVLVLDLTRPDIDFPVARVIVPGLRHFYARLAPGRLYDVPVRLGWLAAPLSENELNPIPMFL